MAPAGKLSIGQKILNASASLHAKGFKKVPRKQVARMCGHPKQEKVFTNALGILKNRKNQLSYDKEFIILTEAGYKEADPEAPLGNNKDALESAQSKFKSGKMKQILAVVADGKLHTRASIASAIGADHTKKSFGNLLGPLRTQGYIKYLKDATGEPAIKATVELIPFGHSDE